MAGLFVFRQSLLTHRHDWTPVAEDDSEFLILLPPLPIRGVCNPAQFYAGNLTQSLMYSGKHSIN